jgi:hypothetical protein
VQKDGRAEQAARDRVHDPPDPVIRGRGDEFVRLARAATDPAVPLDTLSDEQVARVVTSAGASVEAKRRWLETQREPEQATVERIRHDERKHAAMTPAERAERDMLGQRAAREVFEVLPDGTKRVRERPRVGAMKRLDTIDARVRQIDRRALRRAPAPARRPVCPRPTRPRARGARRQSRSRRRTTARDDGEPGSAGRHRDRGEGSR